MATTNNSIQTILTALREIDDNTAESDLEILIRHEDNYGEFWATIPIADLETAFTDLLQQE